MMGLIPYYRGTVFACVILFCAGSDAFHASASPWPRAPGRLLTIIGVDSFRADGDLVFDPPPLMDASNDRFSRIQTNAYLEYGISRKWLVALKTSYAFATVTSPNSVSISEGLSEIEGRLQVQLWRTRRNTVSVAASVGSSTVLGGGVRPGLQSEGIDGEFRVLYGRTLLMQPVKVFAAGEIAYRARFGAAADQVRADLKFGVEPHERALFLLDVFSVTSVGNNQPGGVDFDVLKLAPSVTVRVYKNWRFQLGANYEVASRNLNQGRSLFFNIWSEF